MYTWERAAIENRVRCLDAIIERMGKMKVAVFLWQPLENVLSPMKDNDDEELTGGIVICPIVRLFPEGLEFQRLLKVRNANTR